MTDNQLEKEIKHIIDSGINYIRIKELIKKATRGKRSGIFDANGVEVTEGCEVAFPYIDPMGKTYPNEEDFRAKIVFEHGCFGYYSATSFVPLLEWQQTKKGEYVSNHGNKTIYTGNYTIIVC